MAVMQSIVFASAVILVLLVNEGSAIRCFECNSYNDTRCAHDKPPQDLSVECGNHHRGVTYTFCRKIKQVIEFSVNQLPADTRIIRGCGWDDSAYKDKCYQRSGFGGRQEVCACPKDDCNSSTVLQSSFIGIIAFWIVMFFVAPN
jgi:hypothetical protein